MLLKNLLNPYFASLLVLVALGGLVQVGCTETAANDAGTDSSTSAVPENSQEKTPSREKAMNDKTEKLAVATFGGGCFWCTEAVFQRIKGVEKVVSGYMGGRIENPTYQQVCTGRSGHAEVIQISYDPQQVAYETLLEVFMKTHDPTTLNQQGNDVGTQYRSVIFYHDEKQQEIAKNMKLKLAKAKIFNDPIVTQIDAAEKFYPAEDYHQDYFALNEYKPYCHFVIQPKIQKLEKLFAELLKEDSKN